MFRRVNPKYLIGAGQPKIILFLFALIQTLRGASTALSSYCFILAI